MAKTPMAALRIKRLHDADDHSRCDSTKCAKAAKQMRELEPIDDNYQKQLGLRCLALKRECDKRGLNFSVYVDDVSVALGAIASLDGEEPDLLME